MIKMVKFSLIFVSVYIEIESQGLWHSVDSHIHPDIIEIKQRSEYFALDILNLF